MTSIYCGNLSCWLKVGQEVNTPQGKGVISQLRSDCKYPVFVMLSIGKENCFYIDEITNTRRSGGA